MPGDTTALNPTVGAIRCWPIPLPLQDAWRQVKRNTIATVTIVSTTAVSAVTRIIQTGLTGLFPPKL